MKKYPSLCLFGSYDDTILSSRVILQGITTSYPKEEVTVARVSVPKGEIYTSGHITGRAFLNKVFQRIKAQVKLMRFFPVVLKADVLVILPFGLVDLIQAGFYKYFLGKKIVYVPQNSLYDLFVYATGKTKQQHLLAYLVYQFERFLLHIPDVVFFNTDEEGLDHKEMLSLPKLHTKTLPLGADDTIFFPTFKKVKKNKTVKILFYGEYNLAHGTDVIIKAASLLERRFFSFIMIGDGRLRQETELLVNKLQLKNISFQGWLPPESLVKEIQSADIVLGMFTDHPVARRVIPNKVFQGLATRSCVVTVEAPGPKQWLVHKKHVYFVPANSPKALAKGIRDLVAHPAMAESIRVHGYELFQQKFAPRPVSAQFIKIIQGVKS